MNALAEEQQCLRSVSRADPNAANHSRCWNWFQRGGPVPRPRRAVDPRRNDAEVMDRYRIDPLRSTWLDCRPAAQWPRSWARRILSSTRPSASTRVSPAEARTICRPRSPQCKACCAGRMRSRRRKALATPTIVFHGDRDKTVHPRNSERWSRNRWAEHQCIRRRCLDRTRPGARRSRVYPHRSLRFDRARRARTLAGAWRRSRVVWREPARLVRGSEGAGRCARDDSLFFIKASLSSDRKVALGAM